MRHYVTRVSNEIVGFGRQMPAGQWSTMISSIGKSSILAVAIEAPTPSVAAAIKQSA